MASTEAIVKDLVHRLSAQPPVERRTHGHNRATSLEDQHLGDVVQALTNIGHLVDAIHEAKTLSLADSSIGDQGLRILIQAFKEGSRCGSTLRHLDLANNGITKHGFEALTDALGEGFLPNLEHLIVSQNRLGQEGVNMLAKVLRNGRHSSFQSLDLSHCYIGDDGMVAFADALQSGRFSSWRLESLDLSANRFGERGAIALTRAFFMERLPHLRFLNLSHNKVGEKGTAALADVLKAGRLSILTHLLLSRCDLGNSLVPIARAIEGGHLRGLEALDVSGNHLGDPGSKALAIALRTGAVKSLRHLNLSQCGIGGLQVDLITKAIEAGRIQGLQHLDLSRNSIDSFNHSTSSMLNDSGSFALTRLLKRGYLHQLQYLDLSQCSITDQGLVALAERMASGNMRRLQHFLFRGNEVTEKESIKALVRALESGELSQLQELELGHNSSGEDITMALASALTVSSAQGPLVQSLKERLLRDQKSLNDGTVATHLIKFLKNRSFRGLELIKVNERGLKPADKIFNKFLERQYSSRLPPLVDEGIAAPATTAKFFFNVFLVLSWLFAVLVSKRISW